MCDTLGEEGSNIVWQCHLFVSLQSSHSGTFDSCCLIWFAFVLSQIEQYLEEIIDMIVVQFFQPYDVCAYLQLCP